MQVRQGRTVNNSGRDGLTMLALLMKLCLLLLQNSRVNTRGEQTTAIRVLFDLSSGLFTTTAAGE